MLYHKECGNILKIDLSGSVKPLAEFTIIGKFTAKPVKVDLHKINDGRSPIIFFCKKCNRVVENDEEMVCSCDNCGNPHSSKDMKIPVDSGGIFCPDCIKRFSDEKTYSISIKDFKFT